MHNQERSCLTLSTAFSSIKAGSRNPKVVNQLLGLANAEIKPTPFNQNINFPPTLRFITTCYSFNNVDIVSNFKESVEVCLDTAHEYTEN